MQHGGSDLGPTPYDLLLRSLKACTSMTLRMYASRRKIPFKDITITLTHERIHAKDCSDCRDKLEIIKRRITLVGKLNEEERRKMLDIADKCPVHRTLLNNPQIVTELVENEPDTD